MMRPASIYLCGRCLFKRELNCNTGVLAKASLGNVLDLTAGDDIDKKIQEFLQEAVDDEQASGMKSAIQQYKHLRSHALEF